MVNMLILRSNASHAIKSQTTTWMTFLSIVMTAMTYNHGNQHVLKSIVSHWTTRVRQLLDAILVTLMTGRLILATFVTSTRGLRLRMNTGKRVSPIFRIALAVTQQGANMNEQIRRQTITKRARGPVINPLYARASIRLNPTISFPLASVNIGYI